MCAGRECGLCECVEDMDCGCGEYGLSTCVLGENLDCVNVWRIWIV